MGKYRISFSLLFTFSLLAGVTYGQGSDIVARLQAESSSMGRVEISQPANVANALRLYQAEHTSRPTLRGFRVRIYRGVGKEARKKSEVIMERALSLWPGERVYRTYDSPYYKVSVGDCRTRFDALYLRNRLLSKFPEAFVIADVINFPPTLLDSTQSAPLAPPSK